MSFSARDARLEDDESAAEPSLHDVAVAGVSLVIYSTPCLFAAQRAMEDALKDLALRDGRLPQPAEGAIGVQQCTALLADNLARRDAREVPAVAALSLSPSAAPA